MADLKVVISIKAATIPSSGIRFNAAANSFTSPVAKGTVVGTIVVDPPGWHGDISIDNPLFGIVAPTLAVITTDIISFDVDTDLTINFHSDP